MLMKGWEKLKGKFSIVGEKNHPEKKGKALRRKGNYLKRTEDKEGKRVDGATSIWATNWREGGESFWGRGNGGIQGRSRQTERGKNMGTWGLKRWPKNCVGGRMGRQGEGVANNL